MTLNSRRFRGNLYAMSRQQMCSSSILIKRQKSFRNMQKSFGLKYDHDLNYSKCFLFSDKEIKLHGLTLLRRLYIVIITFGCSKIYGFKTDYIMGAFNCESFCFS